MTERRRTTRANSRTPLSTILLAIIALCLVIIAYFLIRGLGNAQQMSDRLQGIPGQILGEVEEYINPTPTITIDPVTIIREVQSLSRLETASYTIQKVITAEAGGDDVFSSLLFGDKLLLVAQGEVIAGIDLARMGETDIRVVDNTAYVTMPAVEIFVATLDNEGTYVYDRQTGILGQQVDLETQARQEAENAMLTAALEDGILQKAQQNAETFLRGFILAFGVNDVIFIEGTPAPDQTRTP